LFVWAAKPAIPNLYRIHLVLLNFSGSPDGTHWIIIVERKRLENWISQIVPRGCYIPVTADFSQIRPLPDSVIFGGGPYDPARIVWTPQAQEVLPLCSSTCYNACMTNRRIYDEKSQAHYLTFSCYRRRKFLNDDIHKKIVIGVLSSQLTQLKPMFQNSLVRLDGVSY